MVADLRPHALDAGVEHLDVLVDLAGDDRRRRLVDLDPLGARRGQSLQLGVDGGHHVPAEREPVVVVDAIALPSLDVDRQCHRTRNRCFHGPVSLRFQVGELVDGAEALRHRHPPRRAVAGDRVVRVEASLAQRLELLQSLHAPVERLHEEEPAHLTVADHVDARPLLVADGELGRVVEHLALVGGAVLARLELVERGPEPAGEPVTSHDVRVEDGQGRGHDGSFRQKRCFWILPTEVRGKVVRNSTCSGTLNLDKRAAHQAISSSALLRAPSSRMT